MKTKLKYEISVIVVTYNSALEKLIDTLESIINQSDIVLEVVIADDGSENNYFKEVECFFCECQFWDYKLIDNKSNKGTVANIISGIQVATGEYIKVISPGDSLYEEKTLRKWIDFIKENDVDWSFSEAVYYEKKTAQKHIVIGPAHPLEISPHLKRDNKKCRWNYAVLNDIAIGAAMICTRELQFAYMKMIENQVIYAEDNIWRLMMFDGNVGVYYPTSTVLYEYGSGISTNGSEEWAKRIEKDYIVTNGIINARGYCLDAFQKKMLRAIQKNQGKWYEKILIKGKLRSWCLWKFARRMTKTK